MQPSSSPGFENFDGSNSQRPTPLPTLIDRSAFAAMLSVSESTFDRHRVNGTIGPQPVWIGGCLRWHRTEVEAWLAHRNGDGLLSAEAWRQVWLRLNRTPFLPHFLTPGAPDGSQTPSPTARPELPE